MVTLTLQEISIYGMALLYAAAGINHFVNPRFYIGIMPKFLPLQSLLNQASGVAEIILAIGLLFTSTRTISAWLIMVMLVAFFIIHISHLFNPPKMAQGRYWFLYIRVLLQFILIYWAWTITQYQVLSN